MKLFTLTLFIFLLSFTLKAQTWQWVSASTNSVGNSLPGEIVSDKLGYTYSTGTFSNTFIVGPTMSLTSAGNQDIYLIKRDPNGTAVWAKRFGSTAEDNGVGITLDKTGNIILSGKFSQTMAMGTTTLTSAGGFDVFIAKLDNNGIPIWAKSFGGSSSGTWEAAYDVATDTLNNIYATGLFFGNLTLAAGINISSAGPQPDMFILKMDENGTYNWARKGISTTGGFDYTEGLMIKVSHDQNNVVTGGTVRGTYFIFGTDTIVNTSSSTADSYIISLNTATGAKNFIRAIKATGYTEIADLAIDETDNIYATGYCESNTFTEPNTMIAGAGQYRVFIFKYDKNGNFIWSTGIGNSTYGHEPTSILVNHHNKVLVSGYYNHHVQSGTFLINGNGMFLATLDTNKTTIGLEKATTNLASNIYNRSMSIDTADNVYFNGLLYNGISTFGTVTYTATGDRLFSAKFGNPTNIPTSLTENNALAEISVYPNPAADMIMVSGKDIRNIELSDVTGRNIKSSTSKIKELYQLNIKDLAEGIYFVSVFTQDGKQQQKKIIVSR